MGRRENPIGECSKTLNALVSWLRARREGAGLSYEQLAARSKYSAATLTRAASGRGVPKRLDVVQEFARACGVTDLREVEKLWKHARRDEGRARDALAGYSSAVNISLVKSFTDLHSAMLDIYRKQGSPTLRTLEERGRGYLPRSTVNRVLQMRTVPNRTLLLAFAEVCGVHSNDRGEWEKAWSRAHNDRCRSRVVPTPRGHFNPRDLQQLMSLMESTAKKRTGLKLMVHIPTGKDDAAGASEQAARELMVDDAVRRGELSCPGGCGTTSFGYDKTHGWSPRLCDNCKPSTAAPSRQTPPAPGIALSTPAPHPLPQRIRKDEQRTAAENMISRDAHRESCSLCKEVEGWGGAEQTLDLRALPSSPFMPFHHDKGGSFGPALVRSFDAARRLLPDRGEPRDTSWPLPPAAHATPVMYGSEMPTLSEPATLPAPNTLSR
ncbi:helix-turn-helix domain-containing protein [Streptomyces sp. NPDC058665]|uniref:helix-turn-helix domain-containing protein n=1 Tax=Streptomyces sp. NPDC058665 TaxID=3346586 RepID=UPI0036581B5D